MEKTARLPLGVQDFATIRREECIYVDKTEGIYKLVNSCRRCLLTRPRRFGKSLLLSTLRYYFRGDRELFEGLAIMSHEREWLHHEVLYIDLNGSDYASAEDLDAILDYYLSSWERKYGMEELAPTPELRFADVIRVAATKSGCGVSVLIDEYDRPLLSHVGDRELLRRNRRRLRGFMGVLKSMDSFLHFVMVVGVSQFGRASIFSSINNLKDISLLPAFQDLCGFSRWEVERYFPEELERWMCSTGHSGGTEALDSIEELYGGYSFSSATDRRIINPDSMLNSLYDGEEGRYWLAGGTPSFLINLLTEHPFRLQDVERGVCSRSSLTTLEPRLDNAYPLLYQAGYLTIERYLPSTQQYALHFPNREVKEGFLHALLNRYEYATTEFAISSYIDDLRCGRVDEFMKRLQAFMSSVPYCTINDTERHFHNVVYLLFKLLGCHVLTEPQSASGRADMVVVTSKYVYIFEFKIDKSPTEALRQINRRGYDKPYQMSGKRVVKIGVEFSSSERGLRRWKII